jgi:hypothetical protein
MNNQNGKPNSGSNAKQQKTEAKKMGAKKYTSKSLKKLEDELKGLKNQFELSSPKMALENLATNKDFRDKIELYDASSKGRGKLAALERAVGSKFIKVNDPSYENASISEKYKVCEAIYADDIASVLGLAAQYGAPMLRKIIASYGPDVLNWLFTKAKKYVNSYSHGSGPGLKSTGLAISDGMSLNRALSGAKWLIDNNTVCVKYLAAIFCPEEYTSLTPDFLNAKLVNTTKTYTVDFTSGTDGNFLMYYLPDGVTLTGAATSWQYAYTTAVNTSNIQTGLGSAYAYGPGIYNTSGEGNISRYRAGPGSIRIVPNLAAINNSGVITLAYSTDQSNETMSTATTAIPINTVLNLPFVHIACLNGTKEYRQIHLPHSIEELGLDDFASTYTQISVSGDLDYIYMNGTGLPVATDFCKAYFTQSIDYMPGDSVIGLVKPESTPDAPASIPCACTILKRMPHLAQLDLDAAKEFAEFLVSQNSDRYGDIVGAVLDFAHRYKPRPRMLASGMGGGGGGGGAGGLDSFDMDFV